MPDIPLEPDMRHVPADSTAQRDPNAAGWDKLSQMLDELPPGIPTLPPEDAMNFQKYRHKPPFLDKDHAWNLCIEAIEKYDNGLCKAYREEIDTLLVFSGLFSAVVTGFTVESYQWLQNDPSDAMIALLAQIAQSVGPNATTTAPSSASGLTRSESARINAFWFLSLALSLSSALVAILGKQWIREYERRAVDLTPKELVGVRQLKLEGLEYWRVGGIISALPLLLQLSLALFALDILELLWRLEVAAVALTACVPALAALLFYFMTTILPVVQYSRRFRDNPPPPPQCPFKSPQALLVLQTYQLVSQKLTRLRASLHRRFHRFWGKAWEKFLLRMNGTYLLKTWLVWNDGWTKTWNHWDRGFYITDRHFTPPRVGGSHFRGLHWLSQNMDEHRITEAVCTCLWYEAHSPDTHQADAAFHRSAEMRESRLRRGLLHRHPYIHESLSNSPLWLCAVYMLFNTRIRPEFMSEIFIRNLYSIDADSAWVMLSHFGIASIDPEMYLSFVRAIASYARLHVHDDVVSDIIDVTSNIVLRVPDEGLRPVLHQAVVVITIAWLRARAFPRHIINTTKRLIPLGNALDILCDSSQGYLQHPDRLRDLPHVEELAALTKFAYEAASGTVTWPMTSGVNQNALLMCTRDKWNRDYENRTPVVVELLKMSVCGINPIGNASEPDQSRDSHDRAGIPVGDVVRRVGPPVCCSAAADVDTVDVCKAKAQQHGPVGRPSVTKMVSCVPDSAPIGGHIRRSSTCFGRAGSTSSRDNASTVSAYPQAEGDETGRSPQHMRADEALPTLPMAESQDRSLDPEHEATRRAAEEDNVGDSDATNGPEALQHASTGVGNEFFAPGRASSDSSAHFESPPRRDESAVGGCGAAFLPVVKQTREGAPAREAN